MGPLVDNYGGTTPFHIAQTVSVGDVVAFYEIQIKVKSHCFRLIVFFCGVDKSGGAMPS